MKAKPHSQAGNVGKGGPLDPTKGKSKASESRKPECALGLSNHSAMTVKMSIPKPKKI